MRAQFVWKVKVARIEVGSWMWELCGWGGAVACSAVEQVHKCCVQCLQLLLGVRIPVVDRAEPFRSRMASREEMG
jgi:hypothetical protein